MNIQPTNKDMTNSVTPLRKGACDICNAQNVEIAHGYVSGLETFYCADGCGEPAEAWNVPGRCDTERAAAAFLHSPALHKIKIEDEWYTRDQIAAKLEAWAAL